MGDLVSVVRNEKNPGQEQVALIVIVVEGVRAFIEVDANYIQWIIAMRDISVQFPRTDSNSHYLRRPDTDERIRPSRYTRRSETGEEHIHKWAAFRWDFTHREEVKPISNLRKARPLAVKPDATRVVAFRKSNHQRRQPSGRLNKL